MGRAVLGAAGTRVAGLFRDGTAAGLGDGPLLDRFVRRGDPAAFEAIVARHGPMVWAVCRAALRDPNDAEDAFQATFLVLARGAGSLRRPDRLGGWLHGVARKVAARARRDASCRPDPWDAEPPDADAPAPDDFALSRERAALLHEEVARLPGKYREPIVLCHLEGQTHDEAAARLGWPVGTVRGRLARGRDRLRDRLARRGLAGPLGIFPMPAVPDWLAATAARAALGSRFGVWDTTARAASARGIQWAEGVRQAMILHQAKTVAAAVLAAGLVITGAGALVAGQAGGAGARGNAQDEPAKAALAEPRSAEPLSREQLLKLVEMLRMELQRKSKEIETLNKESDQRRFDEARARGAERPSPADLQKQIANMNRTINELLSKNEELVLKLKESDKQRTDEEKARQIEDVREKRREAERANLIQRLSQTEAETESLRIKVEAERQQLTELLKTQMRQALGPTVGVFGVNESQVKRVEQAVQELQERFLKDRAELSAKELILSVGHHELEARSPVQAADRSITPALERRLSRIEDALNDLRNAPQPGRGSLK